VATAVRVSLLSNRAACRLLLDDYEATEEDCVAVLRLDPGVAKAYYRRAMARRAMGRMFQAKADLQAAAKRTKKDSKMAKTVKAVRAAADWQEQPVGTTGSPPRPVSVCVSSVSAGSGEDGGGDGLAFVPHGEGDAASSDGLHVPRGRQGRYGHRARHRVSARRRPALLVDAAEALPP
jgi:tetratricopeptide (TPR) repeat protein